MHVLSSSRVKCDSNRVDLSSSLEGMTTTIIPLGAAGIWLEERHRTSHQKKKNSLNQCWDKGEQLDIFEIRKLFRSVEEKPSKVKSVEQCTAWDAKSEENCGSPFNVFPYFFFFSSAIACVCVCVCVWGFGCVCVFLFVGEVFRENSDSCCSW